MPITTWTGLKSHPDTVLGGRVFHCSSFVKTQQEAGLEASVRCVRLCVNVGWPVWCLMGDNQLALGQVATMSAKASLKRQNRHLHRLFYLLQRLDGSVYSEYVPGDLNPIGCLSGMDFDWSGSIAFACAG